MTSPTWDDAVAAWLIKQTERYYVHVVPMIFNHRITLTPTADYPHGYEAGWCYPDATAAVAAARVWDPETQTRPEGFIKEAAPRVSPTKETTWTTTEHR